MHGRQKSLDIQYRTASIWNYQSSEVLGIDLGRFLMPNVETLTNKRHYKRLTAAFLSTNCIDF